MMASIFPCRQQHTSRKREESETMVLSEIEVVAIGRAYLNTLAQRDGQVAG
jgi:hypothetical protein